MTMDDSCLKRTSSTSSIIPFLPVSHSVYNNQIKDDTIQRPLRECGYDRNVSQEWHGSV